MDFKKTVKDKKIWVREEELQNIPAILKKEYQLLQQSVQNDDICGALFRLKDIYEISIKLPSILSIITISARMESDRAFVRMSETQLKKEQEDFLTGRETPESDSELQEKVRDILSCMVKEPLSIGSWRKLASSIVENSSVFALDENLKEILERTLLLFQVKPKKIREQGRYEDIGNWRNKTIGHGTLFINTEAYWEQVYDLVQGLSLYFRGDGNTLLKEFYGRISIEKESDGSSVLKVGEQTYPISEYIYSFEENDYFFDSYYSRQKYAEITNYLDAPRRLKNNPYYENIYSMLDGRKKSQRRKKERQITKSSDREAYACLNCAPGYEKPEFVLDEIRTFMEEHDRGVLHIQMERGMGKSTLAHELDGRYQRGILQEDLKAVVRVYHIRDMQFREENPARDFFTALSSNLSSFAGEQLEMDNEDYYIDGKDIRQQMEHGGDDAPAAFCQYLELFRERYEEELTDHEGTEEELKLVYILDGIDELGSNAGSVLDAIPDPVFLNALPEENHIYLILLSRIQDEEDLQGTARVINYAGIVRGATQREVKLEIAGHQNDALSERLDSILIELKSGEGSNQLVSLQDKEYQHHLDVQIAYWEELKKEIEKVRRYGYEHTEIIEMSEAYFELADQTVSAAEHYSEKIAQHIRTLEIISAVDMLLLLLMMVRSTMVSVRISRMNKQLEKKAYLDLHTGLPNKGSCEKFFGDAQLLQNPTAVIVYDLNDLKLVNDTQGHVSGDQYILNFARLLRASIPRSDFVGRYGGDEFMAVIYDASDEKLQALQIRLAETVEQWNASHRGDGRVALSYASGWAFSGDCKQCTFVDLFNLADKNMYKNKMAGKAERGKEQ